MAYEISVLLSTLLVIIGAYFWWRKSKYSYWRKKGVKNVDLTTPIGRLYEFYTKPMYEIFTDLYKKHGRIFGSFENGVPILYVCDPDMLRLILVKDFHIFSTRREFPDKNKMLFLLNGEDWKRIRTIITPAFTSRRMRQLSHIINECSKTVLDTLKKYSDRGEPVDCKRIFGTFTMDVIANSAFATKIDSLNDPENVFLKEIKKVLAPPSLLQALGFFILPTWILKAIGLKIFPEPVFFENVVRQVIKERKTTGKKYDDMLQLLLDAQEHENDQTIDGAAVEDEVDQYGSVTEHKMDASRSQYKNMTMEELVAQCILFFIVGYETTATTLSFMAYCLALNPECQEKLIKEVDSVFEKNKEVNYDVIREMKYLDCVLLETLRMYPALSRAERTATENYKIENTDIRIAKGTVIAFNIHAMHHDPEFFPDPESFNPERFLSENANHHQYAYLPFGAGPRNCLGMRFALMEIKLCMCHILRNFRFKRGPTTKVPLDIPKRVGLTTVKELPLSVEKRNAQENGIVLSKETFEKKR